MCELSPTSLSSAGVASCKPYPLKVAEQPVVSRSALLTFQAADGSPANMCCVELNMAAQNLSLLITKSATHSDVSSRCSQYVSLWLKSRNSNVTTSLTSPGDIKYLQNQHSFLWLAKSTWIPKEKTENCEAFKMSYGTRKQGDRQDYSAGGLISLLFLFFPLISASKQGTFCLLTLLHQTPGWTAEGWLAVMADAALASPCTPRSRYGTLCPQNTLVLPWKNKGANPGWWVDLYHTVLYLLIKQGPEHWQW